MDTRFSSLLDHVVLMGELAKERQPTIQRMFKEDGSVLTKADLAISESLTAEILHLYPDANVISEESDSANFNPSAPLTFIIDPIDGTNAYSKGMPLFAISVGIIDRHRNPVGGIILLPRFGRFSDSTLIQLEPGSTSVLVNGEEFTPSIEDRDELIDIIVGDKVWRLIKMPGLVAKQRSLCSSVVNLASLFLFTGFHASILDAGCFVWDLAGITPMLKVFGFQIALADGSTDLFSDRYLLRRDPYVLPVYVGSPKGVDYMLSTFVFEP